MINRTSDTLIRMHRTDNVLRELHERLAVAIVDGEDDHETRRLWMRIAERRSEIPNEHEERYPDDPPNAVCTHAEVRGVSLRTVLFRRRVTCDT